MRATLRKQALRILKAALQAADPAEAVLRHVKVRSDTLVAGGQRYRLSSFANIFVLGAGKAGARMAQSVERLLGRRITGGLLNIKLGHAARLRRIEFYECGHP